MNHARIALLILLLAAFGAAHAEVMDKEPSLTQNILWGLVSSGLCFLVARLKPWFLFFVVPLPAFYFWGLLSEIRDPYVGPAIIKEAGMVYIYSGYGLGVLVLASIIGGLWRRAAKAQHNQSLKSGTPESGAP